MGASVNMEHLLLYHIPGWRSSRVFWLWLELESLYGSSLPELKVAPLNPSTFRTLKPPELLAKNPNGKVPTLVHGDIVMFDSCAILPLFDLSILFSRSIMLQLAIIFAATWKNR